MDLLKGTRGRRLLFAALYASEGAPIGFLWWTLPVLLRAEGVATERLTWLLAALGLPWALKFLWAPLIDVARTARFGRRGWIVTMQILMGATLLPLIWLDPIADLELMFACLIAHAVAAATQDVAIDALAVASTPSADRGSINGWMNAGMLVGRALFGALLLAWGSGVALRNVVAALTLFVWTMAALLAFTTEDETPPPKLSERLRGLRTLARDALRSSATWAGLAFAALGGVGYEAVGAVSGPYLIDRGLTPTAVGSWRLVAVACMLVGGLLGGYFADRTGKRLAVAAASCWIAVAILTLAALDSTAASIVLRLAALDAVYLGIGVFTASSYALFMDLTDPRLGATQFTAFMAMTNVCESWSTAAVGSMQASLGYPTAFVLVASASLVALPLLWWLRPITPNQSTAT